MFAADSYLQVSPRAAPQLDRQLDQLADAALVQHLERIVLQDPGFHVERQEPAGVVPGQPERGLGEVVGPEGEELGLLRDLIGRERGPWQLDHRADQIRHGAMLGLEDLLGHAPHDLRLAPQLLRHRHEGNHHFHDRGLAA